MKVRSAAARVLGSLLEGKGSLSALLPPALAQTAERDRSLLQELCYGTCRWQPRLQSYLAKLLDKPLRNKDRDVEALLLLGLYQLEFTRVPDHAAISTAVNASQALKKPWAKGLINGVLRRFQREAEDLRRSLAGCAEFETAHPAWMAEFIRKAWPAEAEAIFSANNQHPPMTLRVNQRQMGRDNYRARLAEAGLEALPTGHSKAGLTLSRPVDVERLPGFDQGWVSVQDEAAQLCAELLDLQSGQAVLDACCAPGGKTAHILESEAALQGVLGLDISPERLERTRATLERLGLEAELLAADASEPGAWMEGRQFDRILLDAPCSASGVIRRHPDIKVLRSAQDVQRLQRSQEALLENLWPLLKPDGLLLYATCSIFPAENSELVTAFMARHADAEQVLILEPWGIEQPVGKQLLPAPDSHDGFYFARLRKRG